MINQVLILPLNCKYHFTVVIDLLVEISLCFKLGTFFLVGVN